MKKPDKLYRATVEITQKAKVACTIFAKNAKDAHQKLISRDPWTDTEDEISRKEISPWKMLAKPKEIKAK